MPAPTKYDWFNESLFNIIPQDAMRILDVGCDTGLLGKALKEQNPLRYVAGIEIDPEGCTIARNNIDAVYNLNVEQDSLVNLGQGFDVIILGDVIEHLIDPQSALENLHGLLADDGELFTSIPNFQHYSIFRNLLKGDFQYRDTGLLDRTHVRFFCLANIDKLMLDAGYEPRLHSRVIKEDPALAIEFELLLSKTGIDKSNLDNMSTFQFQTAARKAADPETKEIVPLTVIAHTTFTGVLKDNFYSSPIFKPGHPHQIMIFRKNHQLADAWNIGLRKAENEYVVIVREEVYLPKNWDLRLMDCIKQIEKLAGNDWIAGCGGQSLNANGELQLKGSLLRAGEARYRAIERVEQCETLDDAVLIMPAENFLEIDPEIGDQLHGVDLALQARKSGRAVFAIGNPCLSNSLYQQRLPIGYVDSQKRIAVKWGASNSIPAPRGVV